MGLELQLGLNRDARRSRMMDTIKSFCDEGRGHMFLLVPEQATHAMTKEVCARIGNRASQYIEVIGFERLATRVLDACGGKQAHMDEGGRLLALAVAANRVKKDMTTCKKSITRPEFLNDLLSMRDSFQLYGIEPGEMKTKVEADPTLSPSLKAKVADLVTLLGEYDKVLAHSQYATSDEIDSLSALMEDNKFLDGTVWFVDGFTEFPSQQLSVIKTIAENAAYTMVSLPCAGAEDPRPSSAHTVLTVEKLSKLHHTEIVRTSDTSSEHPALGYLQNALCDTTPAIASGITNASDVVRLFSDNTTYEECQHVAGTILRAVRKGYRFRDMSVALCDFQRYAPVFEAVCERYNIPVYFASRKDEIARKPIMLAVGAALDSATRGMGKEDVLKYIKTGVSNLSRQEADVLENYALTWNIHGRGWEPTDGWVMHPDGYGREMTEDAQKQLLLINEYRKRSITPLIALRDALTSGATLGEYVVALYDFLEQIQFPDKLQTTVDALIAEGQEQAAMEYAQVSEVLNAAMEQMHGIANDLELPLTDFVKMFKMLCATYKIATIPATIDQVNVYNLEDARFTCSKVRYIMGAEEGTFPSFTPSTSFLTEDEILTLNTLGFNMPGNTEESINRKLGDIATTISGAKKMLIFSYATGDNATPSHLLMRIQNMFPDSQFTHGVAENHIFDADLLTPARTGSLLGRIMHNPRYTNIAMSLSMVENDTLQSTAMRVMDKAGWAMGDLSNASIRGLYGEKINLSATRADMYAACRYHYFLKHGLCLKEPSRGRFDAPIFGTFAHQVLEASIREIESNGGFKAVTDSELASITKKHIEEYTKAKMKGLADQPERYTYLYHRNCREILGIMTNICAEFRCSDFCPTEFELKIGGDKADVPAIQIPGTLMDGTYSGIADRVDTCRIEGKDYFRVVDYKTGKAQTFDMSDILAGMSMQLLMYQAAFHQDGLPNLTAPEAAGVLYVPAKTPIVATPTKVSEEKVQAEHQKMLTRHGMLLKDAPVLHAMEHAEEGKTRFLPIKYGADGTISGDVCSADQLDMLNRYTLKTMGSIVDDMARGKIAANPISRGMNRNACTYCPMKNACHKDACGVKFRYRAQVKADQFWDAIATATAD